MSFGSPGRRGRPPEFGDDRTPPGTRHGGAPERVGWLLRRSRLHLRQGRFARQRAFVEALADIGVATDVSRVSRWEKNDQEVPPAVVSAYEQLLGLPAASLQATARGLHGALSPRRPAPPLFALPAGEAPEAAERRALVLLQVATEGRPTGGQWCELVERVAAAGLLILPPDVADRIVHRLITELGRSLGAAFITRYEALRRLCALPRFIDVALGQIDRIAHEPWSGVLLDVVAVLTEVPGPEANVMILKLARDENPELQRAALWSAATRVNRGEVTGMQLVHLEQALIAMLRAGPSRQVRAAASDVIGCLPEASRQRVLDAAPGAPVISGRHRTVEVGELVPSWAAAEAAASVTRTALAAVEGPDSDDRILVRILREALAHAHHDRRHQAGVLLMLSPLRHVVADAVLAEWATLPPECRLQAAALLTYVADDSHVAELDRRVSADAPDELVQWSWIARGHVGVPVDDPALVDRLHRVDPEVAKAVLYALGMTGSPQLRDLVVDSLPESVQGRSRWWLRSGAAIRV